MFMGTWDDYGDMGCLLGHVLIETGCAQRIYVPLHFSQRREMSYTVAYQEPTLSLFPLPPAAASSSCQGMIQVRRASAHYSPIIYNIYIHMLHRQPKCALTLYLA